MVGAPLTGRVLIIDDVITAGTAIREVMAIVEAAGASAAGVVIGLDRKERGQGALSAIQEVEQQFALKVASIASVDDIVDYVADRAELAQMVAPMQAYRAEYGV